MAIHACLAHETILNLGRCCLLDLPKSENMIKTVLILILTLVVVPVVSYRFDVPLSTDQGSALKIALLIYLSVALASFALAEISGNCSQVDKLWSIMPTVYVWWFAYAGGFQERMLLMAILFTIWGARLTYNFSRRGAYSWKFWKGEEDYRWGVLRQKPIFQKRWAWTLFNLFFISLYQHGLILLFTLPILVAMGGLETPLGIWDYLIAGSFVGFLVVESIADQQQWVFQTEKYRRKHAGETLTSPYAQGFVQSGLWKYMRHPNYTAEQAVWICFYLFAVAATGRWLNWSITGALLLLVLFQGSTDFSEGISAEKYPTYKEYQEKVGRFLPKLW